MCVWIYTNCSLPVCNLYLYTYTYTDVSSPPVCVLNFLLPSLITLAYNTRNMCIRCRIFNKNTNSLAWTNPFQPTQRTPNETILVPPAVPQSVWTSHLSARKYTPDSFRLYSTQTWVSDVEILTKLHILLVWTKCIPTYTTYTKRNNPTPSRCSTMCIDILP